MTASAPPPARYDEFADWYESYVRGEAAGFAKRCSETLSQVLGPGTGVVLDLTCGTGIQASALRQLGWLPVGLDLSTAQLGHARNRMPVVAADATALPIRPSSLPAVAAVMCHTDVDDYAAACRAVSQVLQPGGIFAHIGVHPCYVGAFADRSDPSKVLITPGYWDRDRRFEAWSPRGVRARAGATHLPLGELLATFTGTGLSIDKVVEVGGPVPDILAVRCTRA
jgi:SAM-dependent methyltransferase